MPPIYKNFENKLLLSKFKENITSKIILTNACNNKKLKKVRSQVLKNHEVERFIKVKIANGVIKINTFNKTYRNAEENSK